VVQTKDENHNHNEHHINAQFPPLSSPYKGTQVDNSLVLQLLYQVDFPTIHHSTTYCLRLLLLALLSLGHASQPIEEDGSGNVEGDERHADAEISPSLAVV
jgi:hypothetical protein